MGLIIGLTIACTFIIIAIIFIVIITKRKKQVSEMENEKEKEKDDSFGIIQKEINEAEKYDFEQENALYDDTPNLKDPFEEVSEDE